MLIVAIQITSITGLVLNDQFINLGNVSLFREKKLLQQGNYKCLHTVLV